MAFERYGSQIVAAVLSGQISLDGYSGPSELVPMVARSVSSQSTRLQMRENAANWLTEQYDRAERHETWSILMEVAIVVFVGFELFFSALNYFRGHD